MVQTLCADSLSGYSNATKLFVQSAVRVFCAVCATGTAKLADLEAAPVCSQIEHSSRSLFHMLPVLAISAVAEAADIIASPIRLGMVNPLSGLSPPFQAPLGEYELSRDVFSVYRSQPQEESIVGELGTAAKVGDEVNDAGSDGEVANTEEERSLNSMDLEGSASATLPSIDEEDAEEKSIACCVEFTYKDKTAKKLDVSRKYLAHFKQWRSLLNSWVNMSASEI